MPDTSQNNKRIAKNTLFLYVRMFIMLAVGLFTSRIVLDALGETDYGIYNVIGGVVVLFSFLNQALTTATQRFLNFYLGREEYDKVGCVFCMSMNAYIILSAVLIIVAETLGLWFVNTQLNIPVERMEAANWVYQFTVVTFIINLIRIPYNASIIAYERMGFFAYVSLIEVILKLLVVYLLFIDGVDRLIVYAALYTVIPFIINIAYKIYCGKAFRTTFYRVMWDKDVFKSLFSFSGWSLFGSLANVSVSQGLNIIVNMFCGVTLNAALGIANQVSGHINQFATNFQTAFTPQLVKSHAINDVERFHKLICVSSRFSYFLLFIISLPVFLTTDAILSIWLTTVPAYTKEFCQLILVFSLILAFSTPLWLSVQATGKIRNYQILMSSIIILNVPMAWFFLKLGFSPLSVWVVRIIIEIFVNIARVWYMWKNMNFPVFVFMKRTIIPIVSVTALSLPIPCVLSVIVLDFWANFCITVTVSILTSLVVIYYVGLYRDERLKLKSIIIERINKKAYE